MGTSVEDGGYACRRGRYNLIIKNLHECMTSTRRQPCPTFMYQNLVVALIWSFITGSIVVALIWSFIIRLKVSCHNVLLCNQIIHSPAFFIVVTIGLHNQVSILNSKQYKHLPPNSLFCFTFFLFPPFFCLQYGTAALCFHLLCFLRCCFLPLLLCASSAL